MIKFYKNYMYKEDRRGKIVGIINQKSWKEINYFETKKNQIRANHYHKLTDELFIVMKGKIKITLTKVLSNGKLNDKSQIYFIKKNDVFVIKKMTHHVFEIQEDSLWYNALTKKMDDKNPDIVSF
tara:strand:- start:4721 stop:5095 length:375 start_codon:yes stop_codon:yes gene_type:complete